jgi:hypothetical protein
MRLESSVKGLTVEPLKKRLSILEKKFNARHDINI